MKAIEYTKKVQIGNEVDVVVVGGGIAGTCSAIAAARTGASTILIERFAKLGGNGTSGGVSGFCGESWGQGPVFEDILTDLKKFNAIGPHFYQKDVFMKGRKYDPEILAIVLQEIALRSGVKLFLHTRFVDAIMGDDKNSISAIIVSGKSGMQAIKGKIYIDCTGESDIVHSVGCETAKGRLEDGLQLPMSLMYFIRKVSLFKKMEKVPEDYFDWKPYKGRKDLPMTSFGKAGSNSKSVKIKIPNYDATNTESLTGAEIQARRQMMRVLDYFQRVWRCRWELDHCSSIIGIREGRRIIGEYTLKLEDVRNGAQFDDAIAIGCFPLDAHDPGDDKRTYILPKDQLKVPPYHIPFRCLIPKGMINLLVAGRNLSADQLALSSARVMTTCGMMGTSAGIGAAICIKRNITPLELFKKDPACIKNEMEDQGAIFDLSFYKKADDDS